MHIGIIILGMILGFVAAGSCLVSGSSIWMALVVYSTVGSGGALIIAMLVYTLSMARRGDLALHRQITPDLSLSKR
jgi:hypothetical protein